jgi:hypothetical protein
MTNDSDLSPLILAAQLTPWWMSYIKQFDGLEIWPCKTIDITGQGRMTAVLCKPKVATHWTVYGHCRSDNGGSNLRPIDCFSTEDAAKEFRDRLLKTYPHLAGDRPQSQQNISPTTLTP